MGSVGGVALRSPTSVLEAVHTENRDRVEAALDTQTSGAYEEKYRLVRPDGEFRWVWERTDRSRNRAGDFGEEAPADNMKVIETGEALLNTEESLSSRDRSGLPSKVPWYDGDGEIAGLIGVTRDITDREESERAVEERTERLNELVGVASRDLRNPLNVAQSRLYPAAAD